MSSLEDDIARIAALRGKPAANYVVEAQELQHRQRRLAPDSVGRIFVGNPDFRDDLRYFDALPKRSRDFIRECVLLLNSGWWAQALEACASEETVIGAVLSELPYRTHDFILRHYDRGHPSARKLT